jgi:hypothetical protein
VSDIALNRCTGCLRPLEHMCSAYEKRSAKGMDLGTYRLSELLERAEVKSETMDAPSYLGADTEDDGAYAELIRECADEIKGLSTTFTELRSGFSLQIRLTTQHKMESQIRERQEEHIRVPETLFVVPERQEYDKRDYAFVRRRDRSRSLTRRRASPKREMFI